jgi:hypothetical protein
VSNTFHKENMMIDEFGVPVEFQDKLKNAMKDDGSVKLPFDAPTLWWMNGKTALKNVKEVSNATRFGGWGISRDELDGLYNWPETPSHWQLFPDLVNGQGGTYAAYLTRTVWVAPIARRSGWFVDKEGKGKSSVNILGYLAVWTPEKVLLPHGPVVLSAKSYTGMDLDKCFKDFAAKSAQLRGKTIPAYFYHPIGTWEQEPVFVERKSKGGGASSSVTPPQLYLPKNGITLETLKQWFVGPEVVTEMVKLYDLAQDWVNDWKQRKSETKPEPMEAVDQPPAEEEFEYPF